MQKTPIFGRFFYIQYFVFQNILKQFNKRLNGF